LLFQFEFELSSIAEAAKLAGLNVLLLEVSEEAPGIAAVESNTLALWRISVTLQLLFLLSGLQIWMRTVSPMLQPFSSS